MFFIFLLKILASTMEEEDESYTLKFDENGQATLVNAKGEPFNKKSKDTESYFIQAKGRKVFVIDVYGIEKSFEIQGNAGELLLKGAKVVKMDNGEFMLVYAPTLREIKGEDEQNTLKEEESCKTVKGTQINGVTSFTEYLDD